MKKMLRELVNVGNDGNPGNKYVTVYFDDELDATVDVWDGPFGSKDNFYHGLEIVLENIASFKSKKWLADLSKIEGDFGFVKDYIPTYLLPKAIQMGLKYEALVLPHDIFSILSVQMTLDEIVGFEISVFDNVESAKEWLRSK